MEGHTSKDTQEGEEGSRVPLPPPAVLSHQQGPPTPTSCG